MSTVNILAFRVLGAVFVLTCFLLSAPCGFADDVGSPDFCVFADDEGFYLTSDARVDDGSKTALVVYNLISQDGLRSQDLIDALAGQHLVADQHLSPHASVPAIDARFAREVPYGFNFTFHALGGPNPGDTWALVGEAEDASLSEVEFATHSEVVLLEDVEVFGDFSSTYANHSALVPLPKQRDLGPFASGGSAKLSPTRSSPLPLLARRF